MGPVSCIVLTNMKSRGSLSSWLTLVGGVYSVLCNNTCVLPIRPILGTAQYPMPMHKVPKVTAARENRGCKSAEESGYGSISHPMHCLRYYRSASIERNGNLRLCTLFILGKRSAAVPVQQGYYCYT